ncbi:MAG: hypothetical protein ABI760_09305 [Ferruginibacter sp.]
MAKQIGLIKLLGTIGGITFYKTQDGFLARQASGGDQDINGTDPRFQGRRDTNEEFINISKVGKLIRVAFMNLSHNISDNRVSGRLVGRLIKVKQADFTHPRGKRTFIDGKLELLEGFDFNIRNKLEDTLLAPFTAIIDRKAGTLNVSIPSFIPVNMVARKRGSTHFKIITSGAAIDFKNKTFEVSTQKSDLIAWDNTATTAIDFANTVAANSSLPLFLVLGVEFYTEVKGVNYPMEVPANKVSFNSLAMVSVNDPKK